MIRRTTVKRLIELQMPSSTVENYLKTLYARQQHARGELVPMGAVAGIFAKETGYGFAFAVASDPAASLAAATAPRDGEADDAKARGNGDNGKPRSRPSHLQVIK